MLPQRWAKPLNALARRLAPQPYTPGALLAEAAAALHMLRHRGALYHVLYGDSDLSFLPAVARLTGNRLIATFHEPERVLAEWRVGRRYVRRLDAIILLSETQRRHFAPLVPAERTFVIPHSVDTRFFAPDPRVPRRSKLCLVVGGHLRDMRLLGDTMRAVWSLDPAVRFVVVGAERGDLLPSAPPSRLIVRGRITDDQLLQWYCGATLALFALSEVTASNALLEALATATPIVANDHPAVREYAADAAVLCPSAPAALAAGARSVLDDPVRAAALGALGRSQAERLDDAAVAQQIARVYRTVGTVVGASADALGP